MELVCNFEDIAKLILKKRGYDSTIVVGILVADWRQREVREYILNYINQFDEHSGEYIDFYIPGYYRDWMNGDDKVERKYHPYACIKAPYIQDEVVTISRDNGQYRFDANLFETFLHDLKTKMNIKYEYNPMLILIEVHYEHFRDEISYGDYLVIDLDEDASKGVRRAGALFDDIFDYAQRKSGLKGFRNRVRIYYLKGGSLKDITTHLIKKEWIDAVADVAFKFGYVQKRFRIKKQK